VLKRFPKKSTANNTEAGRRGIKPDLANETPRGKP
jgi:hypothetical protein